MRRLIAERGIDTVWFGAAAPLGVLAQRARQAGATRVLASTHGHEVGWSMLPVARSVLRRIGDDTDAVTFVSRYTRGAFRVGVRPQRRVGAPATRRRHRPVSPRCGEPGRAARPLRSGRAAHGALPVPAGAAQGPGHADPALPAIRRRVDGAALVIAGGGPYWRTCTSWPSVSASVTTSSSPVGSRPPSCPRITRWPTCSRCHAAPAVPDWMSRGWVSCSWKRPPPAYRWSPARRAVHRKPCGTTRLGWWSTVGR